MEAKDFRIGNLLQGKHGIYKIDYLQTNQKDEKQIQAWCIESGKEAYGATEESLKPIPLTEEILLKCGFEKIKDQEVYKVGEYLLRKYCNNMLFFTALKFGNFSLAEIKHLHQLQNLYFALTNKELEIKL